MKKIYLLILFSVTYFFFSCGNDEKKQPKEAIQPVNKLTPAPVKKGVKISSKSIKTSEEFGVEKTAANQKVFAVKNAIAITPTPDLENKTQNANIDIKKEANDKLLNFI